MKTEIRNIKHIEHLSHETHCYSATLYIDGKKIGMVSNEGHGGPDCFQGDERAFREAESWLAENTSPVEIGGHAITMNMEIHCADLVNAHLAAKGLRSALRASVLFQEEGSPEILQVKWKGMRKVEGSHIAAVVRDHQGAIILNTIPFDQALQIYRTAG